MENQDQNKPAKTLTDKEQRFVEEYCACFNATEAARRADYSERSAYALGSRLLRKVEVSAAISERLAELGMTAGEATKRLTDWGRGTIEPFLKLTKDGNISLTLASPEAKQNYHLIKKIKQTRQVTKTEEGEIEEIRTELELHDAKDAVIQIAKIHGQFITKVDHTTAGKELPDQKVVQIYLPSNGRE